MLQASSVTIPMVLLPESVAVCQLPSDAAVPDWTRDAARFLTITRTPSELSIVADEDVVPDTVTAQRGYRILRVDGPLPLNLVGIFAALAGPLAAASVPIFPIATYETDYLLVHGEYLTHALAALRGAGHVIR